MPILPPILEVQTSLRLIDPESSDAIPASATLCYDLADPYAVRMVFHASQANDKEVDWVFARELLVMGLDERTGIGDVCVWPVDTGYGDFVILALSSPDGYAWVEFHRHDIMRFLRRTCVRVPRGRESEHLDVDGMIDAALKGK